MVMNNLAVSIKIGREIRNIADNVPGIDVLRQLDRTVIQRIRIPIIQRHIQNLIRVVSRLQVPRISAQGQRPHPLAPLFVGGENVRVVRLVVVAVEVLKGLDLRDIEAGRVCGEVFAEELLGAEIAYARVGDDTVRDTVGGITCSDDLCVDPRRQFCGDVTRGLVGGWLLIRLNVNRKRVEVIPFKSRSTDETSSIRNG
jgi:hypothetical protein